MRYLETWNDVSLVVQFFFETGYQQTGSIMKLLDHSQ